MKKKWTFETCQQEALKYKTRVDFQKKSKGAYQIAIQNKWTDAICTHMTYLHFPWTEETVREEARKYKKISEFQRNASGAYKAACRLNILYEACAHMPRVFVPDRKMPLEKVKSRLRAIFGDTVTIDEAGYQGARNKCKFFDSEFGEWVAAVDRVLKNKSVHPKRVRLRMIQASLNKWGTEHPVQSQQVQKRKNDTILKKYGVTNVSSSEAVKAKKRATTLSNFGVEYPSQSQKVRDKQKETCLKNYGVPYAAQNYEVALKVARSSNITKVLEHWKTGQELVCQAGYEIGAVNYLNSNKIEYDWQPQVFNMPDGRTYRPDLYLVAENKWVEIKGYMRKDAQEKWDWFQSIMSNSELWDKKRLISLGILKQS